MILGPAISLSTSALYPESATSNPAQGTWGFSYSTVTTLPDHGQPLSGQAQALAMSADGDEQEARPSLPHAMLAGGLGGAFGDMLMHPLDTVKTRQQADWHNPPRYNNLVPSFFKILRQEGVRRGLYSGWLPALLGSLPGTLVFFGTYEFTKRHMLSYEVRPNLAFLTSGLVGDLVASIIYVPSEVLKIRLQLQGQHNNPFFKSGYNYRGLPDAVRTMTQNEGTKSLLHGYKATLCRDLPFSALQFMFYEQGRGWARTWRAERDIGWPLELFTGGLAGGLAGTITCPLDVVKTLMQTQLQAGAEASNTTLYRSGGGEGAMAAQASPSGPRSSSPKRRLSTSSPSTHTPQPGAIKLNTVSVTAGLGHIYRSEGLAGWFRGAGPRAVWTSIQSGTMLFVYQTLLGKLHVWMPTERAELRGG